MIPAFGYVRVSGAGQMDGDGPERQELAIRRYAAQHGYRIVAMYTEAGVCGAKGEDDRPAFCEMLRDTRAKAIIFESLDRLARDLMTSETLIGTMRRRGFDVLSDRDPDLCSDDPTRILIRHVLSAIAEWDRRVTVAKLRGARQRMKARDGRCEGRKPFGHYEGEGLVLGRIRALRDSGLGYDRIAHELNCDGVQPRYGKQWHGATVNRILRKE